KGANLSIPVNRTFSNRHTLHERVLLCVLDMHIEYPVLDGMIAVGIRNLRGSEGITRIPVCAEDLRTDIIDDSPRVYCRVTPKAGLVLHSDLQAAAISEYCCP